MYLFMTGCDKIIYTTTYVFKRLAPKCGVMYQGIYSTDLAIAYLLLHNVPWSCQNICAKQANNRRQDVFNLRGGWEVAWKTSHGHNAYIISGHDYRYMHV